MCLIIKLPIHKNNIPVNFGIVNYRTACIVRLSHWATPSTNKHSNSVFILLRGTAVL